MKNRTLKLKDITTPFIDGFTNNNPIFRLILGTCPTLAISTTAMNGLAMGLATTFVMVCSNCIISLLRNIIPGRVRIPCYIVIIATFVTVIQMFMNYALPDLYQSLGLFLPLITVNCIVFARVESFASANPVIPSIFDGLGVGLGYVVSLTFMSMVREFLGSGAIFGYAIPGLSDISMTIFVLPAGGFFVYGFLMVIFNKVYLMATKIKEKKHPELQKEGGNE